MNQYLLAVHSVEGQENYLSEADMQVAFKAVAELNTEIRAKGAWVFGGGL
ncbi:MAG: hypothetical protein QOJ09_901, partial [Actinomycetota bacterium]|nr:hypothetical protein [Actinomycetota bacterium]